MYNILKLNKIAEIGTSRLGENYNCVDECDAPDAVLVRSASMHDMEMPESLLAIARAGAGVNNIPLDKCTEKGICVFNTPGANANAVMELVIAGLFMGSRKLVEGIEWAKSLKGNGDQVLKMVEKGKSKFAGPEIKGKTLGVIGLGAIGILVANAARALHMNVIGYDPYLSVEAALKLDRHVHTVASLDEIYAQCDYITLHVPLLGDTKGMINEATIAKMKDGVRILNFARDGLVVSGDIVKGLESGKIGAYVTDFATDDLLGVDGVVLTKMDGDTRGGAALSIKAVTGKPILFVGMGEKLSDMEQFYPDRMASRILGMGDVLSLIDKAQANLDMDEDKAKDMAGRMKKGKFDFEDYLESMKQMRKMGGLGSILSMMPGMGVKAGDLEGMIDEKQLAHMEAIVLSMTPEERRNPKLLNPKRKHRIAKGAGVDIAVVNRFIKQFEQSQKVMKQFAGGGKRRGFGGFPGMGGGRFPF